MAIVPLTAATSAELHAHLRTAFTGSTSDEFIITLTAAAYTLDSGLAVANASAPGFPYGSAIDKRSHLP